MPVLYSCRHSGDQYAITKFDEDMNVQSHYLCTLEECDCPAGTRPICRHREMLPLFIAREAIDSTWFYDYDRGGWVQMDFVESDRIELEDEGEEIEGLDESEPAPLPEGVVMHDPIPDAITQSMLEPAPAPRRKPDGRRV